MNMQTIIAASVIAAVVVIVYLINKRNVKVEDKSVADVKTTYNNSGTIPEPKDEADTTGRNNRA